jgi:hypothetical protein
MTRRVKYRQDDTNINYKDVTINVDFKLKAAATHF